MIFPYMREYIKCYSKKKKKFFCEAMDSRKKTKVLKLIYYESNLISYVHDTRLRVLSFPVSLQQ